MNFYAATVKPVKDDRPAQSDESRQLRYLAMPCRADVFREFFPYFSRKRHTLTLSFL